ncbi:MAG: hypothetical protein EBV40_04565 [Actinobacteria bacterium]|nr:hypothetical protein [Actinomycetota bacterium]
MLRRHAAADIPLRSATPSSRRAGERKPFEATTRALTGPPPTAMRPADLLQLLMLACAWGGAYLFMRAAVPAFGPAPMVFLRLAMGSLEDSRCFMTRFGREKKTQTRSRVKRPASHRNWHKFTK